MLNSHGSWRGVSPNSAWIAGIAGPMMAMSSAPHEHAHEEHPEHPIALLVVHVVLHLPTGR